MKPKHLLIILIPIGIIGVSFISFMIYQISKGTASTMANFKRDSVAFSQALPKEYSDIFKKNGQLVFNQTIKSKRRNPFSQFQYAHGSLITIYSMGHINNSPFDQLITETDVKRHITYDTSYTTLFENEKYELQSKSGKAEKISHIYLNSYSIKPILISKNDSVAYYSTNFTNFDIKRSLDGPQDIFCGVKNNYIGSVYAEIMFLKRNNNLYLVLLCNEKKSDENGGILAKLIN